MYIKWKKEMCDDQNLHVIFQLLCIYAWDLSQVFTNMISIYCVFSCKVSLNILNRFKIIDDWKCALRHYGAVSWHSRRSEKNLKYQKAMWSVLLPPDSHFLSAYIAIKFSLSIKYVVKILVKNIRCNLKFFGYRIAWNIGLIYVAVQTSIPLHP